jgi:phage terminase large subunit
MSNIKVDKRQAINLLWRQGNLRWKLDKNQLEIYNFVNKTEEKTIVIGSSRRIGKSYFLLTYAIEFCLKNPNSIVKFIAPTRQMVTSYIRPLFYEITVDCPKDVLPSYRTKENIYKFHNGSEIQLAGTDNGNADRIRGGNAHLCILDEVGFIDDLDYVVNSVLLPTTTMTKGKIIMASTPPKSMDHPFIGFIRRAEEAGAYIRKTIYDNPRLTEEEIEAIAESVGGYDTVDFKREYLAELVVSEEDSVVPEFNKELEREIVKEVIRPELADTYVSMDIGGNDLTVILFGFYDFMSATIVIQDELVFNRKVLTDEIASAVQSKELELWGYKAPVLRVADNNNIILLNDLTVKHGLNFVPTMKDDKLAQLNNMRILLKRKKILINPKCRTLISHIKGATWNKQRTSYSKSPDKGHYDALDALVYFVRNVNMNKNPYPENHSFSSSDYMIVKHNYQQPTTQFEHALVQRIRRTNPFRRR